MLYKDLHVKLCSEGQAFVGSSAYQVLLEVRVKRLEKSGGLEVALRTDSLVTNHRFLL